MCLFRLIGERVKGPEVDLVYSGVQASQLRSARWRKSRYSNPSGNCVEMAQLTAETVAVRDSWCPDGPTLIFTRASWQAFLHGLQDGCLS
jgi:Domain of unknown function (DUF397)